MKIPTLFNCPLWIGLKRRVAKRHLNKTNLLKLWRERTDLHHLVVGDLINDCTSFNGELLKIEAKYDSVRGGKILHTIHLTTTSGGCDMFNCGVEKALSREEVEKRHLAQLNYLMEYGLEKNSPGRSGAKARKSVLSDLEILNAGGHIADEQGRRLK